MNKADLRKYCIGKRHAMDVTEKLEKDKRISETVYNIINEIDSKNVLIYLSTSEEIDTLTLVKMLLSEGYNIFAPKCIADGVMKFYKVNSLSELVDGKYNIKEPVSLEEPDFTKQTVCVVPALSIDKSGNRIGYGKGYYDRFLEQFKGTTIGLCYNSFFMEEIPKENTDVAVNIVVTEKHKYIVEK